MQIIGLGAICDFVSDEPGKRGENRFNVSEFAQLDSGERVILHSERGYVTKVSHGDAWTNQTAESITRDVLTTVLPDDDATEDEHPWEWLADLARRRGLVATADDLRQVPYEVILTGRVLQRLSKNEPASADDA